MAPASAGQRAARWVEVVGFVAVLAALTVFLLRRVDLIPYSDPVEWYRFGLRFGESFGHSELAYGFPLLVAGAVSWMGPYRAYLVNLPVLVVLSAVLYAFAAQHVPRRADGRTAAAPVAGAAALLLLLWIDGPQLLRLASPYRDALAHLFLLLACVLCVATRRSGARSLALPACAGACLALAYSTRETSLLLLPPLLAYGLVSRAQVRSLPFGRPALAFALGFGVAVLPALVHSALVSGSPLIPPQAAQSFAEEGRLLPGVRLRYVGRTLPQEIAWLADHYGLAFTALLGVGAFAALRRRDATVLALSAPAFLIHALFYGAYGRVVDRYLFVLDLFALPVAASGVAYLVERALARERRARLAATATALALFAAAAASALVLSRADPGRPRLGVGGLTAFMQRLDATLPDGARLVGVRHLIDVARGLSRHESLALDHRWELLRRMDSLFGSRGDAWLLSNEPEEQRLVAAAFDLVDTVRLLPQDYGLEGHFGPAPIHLSRVVPWSRRRATATVSVESTGPHLLLLDAGHLGRRPRDFAHVYCDGRKVGGDPRWRVSAFPVSVERAPALLAVELVSDEPVPALLGARLIPADGRVDLDFEGQALLPYLDRVGGDFLGRPDLPFPALAHSGVLDLPTPAPRGAAFVVVFRAGLQRGAGPAQRRLAIEVARERVHEQVLRSDAQPGDGGPQFAWETASFVLPPRLVSGPTTRLTWIVEADEGGPHEPPVGVAWVRVHRQPLAPELTIDTSAQNVGRFLLEGFRPPQRGVATGRRTGDEAALRLLALPDPRPALLTVRYRTLADAGQVTFTLDGRPLEGSAEREPLERGARVTERFRVEPAWLDDVEGQLAIDVALPGAQPAPGIVLEQVVLERVALAPR